PTDVRNRVKNRFEHHLDAIILPGFSVVGLDSASPCVTGGSTVGSAGLRLRWEAPLEPPTATYHCLWNGSWDGETGNYASCTTSPYDDPELKLLEAITQDIGDFVPWEQSSLRGENWQWQEKINQFKNCLEDVLLRPPPLLEGNETVCPRTWDGWSCWDDTLPGHTVYAPCPQFVAGFLSSRQAHKYCNLDGTWFRHPVTKHIWSNYTACVDTHDLQLSFAFLVNIVRVLVTKLRAVNSPDNESTRKAVRATVILLPLLGLHYVVTPFRPDKGSIFLAYEIISALVTSLQGLCVALLFCFFNGEVLGVLRKTLSQTPCVRSEGRRMSYANTSISFLPRRASDGRSPSASPNHLQQTML
ncbi:hypothetical protein HPB47_010409, partial [Ixodes persulcatus]